MRQSARFAERHRNAHRFPGLPFVSAAAYPYIDHFLQVHAAVIADIVHTQECSVIGRYQPRNTESRNPVVTGMADTDSHTAHIRFAVPHDCRRHIVDLRHRHLNGKGGQQGSLRLHLDADPVIVDSFHHRLVTGEGHDIGDIRHFALFNGVGGIGCLCLAFRMAGNIGNRAVVLSLPGSRFRSAIEKA